MERSPILLDRQNQHIKNGNLAKSSLQIQRNPHQIPTQFFTDLERTILNFKWKNKKPRIAKTTLYKLYYRAIVLKTAWYWHKNRQIDQCNPIENPDIKPHMYEHLIFDKEAKFIQWKKESIFNKWCWYNWNWTCRQLQLDPYLSACTNIKSKSIKDIIINPATLNPLEEKMGDTLEQIGTGDRFLNI